MSEYCTIKVSYGRQYMEVLARQNIVAPNIIVQLFPARHTQTLLSYVTEAEFHRRHRQP